MEGEIDMYYRQAVAAFMEAQIRDQYPQAPPSCPPASSASPAWPRPTWPARIQPAGLHLPDLHRPARPGIPPGQRYQDVNDDAYSSRRRRAPGRSRSPLSWTEGCPSMPGCGLRTALGGWTIARSILVGMDR